MVTQVLIVGAGPVGLTLALELRGFGVSVRIIDKAPARSDKSKALVVWSRTLELLEHSGLAQTFVATGNKVDTVCLFSGGKRWGRVTFDQVDSTYPYALLLPQSETERLLEDHCGSLGVRVERGVELLEFEALDSGVVATIGHAGGGSEVAEAAWLVGCDGAHSVVRRRLAVAFAGETLASDWVLADLRLSGVATPVGELAMYLHADGVLALFPLGDDRYRVIADVGHAPSSHPAEPTLATVQALLDRRGPRGIVAAEPRWLSGFRINERKVGQYRHGRVFLAGDAAHVHSPAGGQGMNTGMQDAFNLGWKLAMVTSGVARESLLDSYSAERGPVAQRVLRNAGAMTTLATLRNPAARSVRNFLAHTALGLSAVRRRMADTLTEVEIGYATSPLNGHRRRAAGPAPGKRVRVAHCGGGVSSGARFSLLGVPGPEINALMARFADVLDPHIRPPLKQGWMGLVRPDGHLIAYAKTKDAAAEFQRVFDHFLLV